MVTSTSGADRFIISVPSIPSSVAHCRTLTPGLCFYRESFCEQTLTDGQRPRSPGGSTPAIGEGPKRRPERTTLTSRKRSPLSCAKVQAAIRHRHHHFTAHHLPFQVGVGIVPSPCSGQASPVRLCWYWLMGAWGASSSSYCS